MDLQIDAYNFAAAVGPVAASALAQFGKAQVGELAEFNASGYQHCVDVYAVFALKLKEHGDKSLIVRAPAKHPATVA